MNRGCKVLKHTIIVILETHSWQQRGEMKKSQSDNFFFFFFNIYFFKKKNKKKLTKFHSINGSSLRLTKMATESIENNLCIF
jgi:hypothetical protein